MWRRSSSEPNSRNFAIVTVRLVTYPNMWEFNKLLWYKMLLHFLLRLDNTHQDTFRNQLFVSLQYGLYSLVWLSYEKETTFSACLVRICWYFLREVCFWWLLKKTYLLNFIICPIDVRMATLSSNCLGIRVFKAKNAFSQRLSVPPVLATTA